METRVGQPAKSYTHQLCADIGFSLEELPVAIDDGDGWVERVKRLRAFTRTW